MPAAARQWDLGLIHCSPWVMMSGASNVKINGRGACRVGDGNIPHLQPTGDGCKTHTAKVFMGSKSVLINKKGAARVGDMLMLCTIIIDGSKDVVIG